VLCSSVNQQIAAVHSIEMLLPRFKLPFRLKERSQSNIDRVAFPDDGAAKRFSALFKDMDLKIIVCGKTRRR
jgi:hypothetical protein